MEDKYFLRILPLYGVLPILCSVLFNILVYFGNRIFTSSWKHYELSLPIDDLIPFESWAIVFYLGAYLLWVVGVLFIAREEKALCYELFSGELLGKLLCLLFFLFLPTYMATRPDGLEAHSLFDRLTRIVYDLDPPDNLFPSIHCMESWVVLHASFRCRRLRRPVFWRVPFLLGTLAVFLSTLLVKQHVLLDVLGGVAVAEAGMFLARVLNAGRIYPALARLFRRNRSAS